MIYLGLKLPEKIECVTAYCREYAIRKVVVISTRPFMCEWDHVETLGWKDVIRYKFFYRLLQEIDQSTLIVLNEVLQTKERSCLTYNCIRHYLRQTDHQLVFNYLPFIDSMDDFMILLDFDTRSRWAKESFHHSFLADTGGLSVRPVPLRILPQTVSTSAADKSRYEAEKKKRFDTLGLSDPHTLPRQLHVFTGKFRLSAAAPGTAYVGRNNRFKLPDLKTYEDDSYPENATVFDFCHDFREFGRFVEISGQTDIPALVTDLKVDQWYLLRYQNWIGTLHECYSALQ